MDYLKSLYNTIKGIINYGNFKKCLSVGWEAIKYFLKILIGILNMFLNWFIHIFTGFTSSDLDKVVERISEENKESLEDTAKKYEELKTEVSKLNSELEFIKDKLNIDSKVDSTNNSVIIEEVSEKEKDDKNV